MDAVLRQRLETRDATLLLFALATALLIPIDGSIVHLQGADWARALAGCAAWLWAGWRVLRDGEPQFRRRMGTLLAAIGLLALAPVHTDTSTPHFLILGGFFLAVVLLPPLLLRRTDPDLTSFRLWPKRIRRRDLIYTLISVPLAWSIIHIYFFMVNPELPTHWHLPEQYDLEAVWRLVIGINCVGIWDELFFINVVFALLRSLYGFWRANLAQAVVYTSVLYDMAFTGIGPFIVYAFALTQGSMYEGSRRLVWVLIVHLIVDAFLLEAIIQYHYAGHGSFHWF